MQELRCLQAAHIHIYDLRSVEAWRQAREHRNTWGRLYTDIYDLASDRIVLVFRPAPDEGWRSWELVRLSWILDEDLEGRAA